jgi:hypothetical protein
MSQKIMTEYTHTLGLFADGAAAAPELSCWISIGAGLMTLQAKRFLRSRI